MTKPSDFILNSDYLALAQTGSAEGMAVFAAETFPAGTAYTRTADFTVPATPGAIDMFLVSRNGDDYTIGSSRTISMNSPNLWISIYRLNATTIRVMLREFTNTTGGYSMPTQTIRVKVSSFKPPNVL